MVPLAEIFLSALNNGMAAGRADRQLAMQEQAFQQDQDQKKAAAAQADMQREAEARYYGGQPGMLQLINPGRFGELQKLAFEQDKARSEMERANTEAQKTRVEADKIAAEQQRQRSTDAANLQRMIAAAPAGPQRDSLLNYAYQNQDRFGRFEVPGENTTPEQLAGIKAQADTGIALNAPPRHITNDMYEAASRLGYKDNVAAAENDKRWASTLDTVSRSRATQVNMPGALDGAAKSEAQKNNAEGELLLADIADLRALGDPSQYLGLRNKAKNFVLGTIASVSPESLDPSTVDQLGKARQFREGVDQIYLRAKKDITGVSAGEKELQEIRGAVLNTDMSKPEFQASLDKLERVTRRNMDIRSRLLREGLDLSSKVGQDRFSSEIRKAQSAERGPQRTAPQAPPPPGTDPAFDAFVKQQGGQ